MNLDFAKMGAVIEEPLRLDDIHSDRTGALELIELGNAHGNKIFRNAKQIEASGRQRTRPRQLGALPNVFGFFFGVVGEGVSKITGVLSDILALPVDLISKGVGEVLGGFASIVGQIPVIGEIAATILLAANSIIQAALDLPEQILKVIGNLGLAFKTLDPKDQSALTQTAMSLLINAAPPDQKAAVQQKLQAAPPPGSIVPEAEGGEFPFAEVATVAANALAIGALFVL